MFRDRCCYCCCSPFFFFFFVVFLTFLVSALRVAVGFARWSAELNGDGLFLCSIWKEAVGKSADTSMRIYEIQITSDGRPFVGW